LYGEAEGVDRAEAKALVALLACISTDVRPRKIKASIYLVAERTISEPQAAVDPTLYGGVQCPLLAK
jgi:hypothetical protein